MVNWSDPLVQLKVTCSVCSFVACVGTIQRLYIRRDRLWVDDAWAFLSMLVILVQDAAIFMHVPITTHMSRTNRIASYYMASSGFYVIIWAARLSILFSIIRIHPNLKTRRRLLYISIGFIVVLLVLLAQLFWVCEPEPHWKDLPSPQCNLGKEVAISQLITDVLSDLILIVAPLRLLQGLEDRGLRLRLMVIFSTCIITTIVSLVHAAYILRSGGNKIQITALVECSISLIVCNIPVVVTASMRYTTKPKPDSEHTAKSTRIGFATRVFSTKTLNPTDAVVSLGDLSHNTSYTKRSTDLSFDLPTHIKTGSKEPVTLSISDVTDRHSLGK